MTTNPPEAPMRTAHHPSMKPAPYSITIRGFCTAYTIRDEDSERINYILTSTFDITPQAVLKKTKLLMGPSGRPGKRLRSLPFTATFTHTPGDNTP